MKTLPARLGKFVVNNSPTILAALGATGVLTTAYFSAQAALKSKAVIDQDPYFHRLSKKEQLKLVWKFYIPAGVSAGLTIAAIVYGNRVGVRRAAAVATALAISERTFDEYRNVVRQKLGEKKAQEIQDEVAQSRVNQQPVDGREVFVSGRGDVLCHEAWTGRYFMSDMETLRKAQNDINAMIINHGFASMTDFYNMVGLPKTSDSDQSGWTTDRLLELIFSPVLATDGRPCISFEYRRIPQH